MFVKNWHIETALVLGALFVFMFLTNITGKIAFSEAQEIFMEEKSGILMHSGNVERTFRFSARASNDLWETGSWILGGFVSKQQSAVFYVDVGVMKAFVENNGAEWCGGIENDWKEYHDFAIKIDRENGSTLFYIDGGLFCTINETIAPSPVVLRNGDDAGRVSMEFSGIGAI